MTLALVLEAAVEPGPGGFESVVMILAAARTKRPTLCTMTAHHARVAAEGPMLGPILNGSLNNITAALSKTARSVAK